MQPPLTVLIPTLNRERLLGRAVESALAQSYPARIIVIDDGSTDGTPHYLTELARTESRVEVITHAESRGVNAARNDGMDRLRPEEWAVLLDDDDTLLPGALERISRRIQEVPPQVQVLFFNTERSDASGDSVGGYRFAEGEEWHEPSYFEAMSKAGLDGDCKPVLAATLFTRGYRFSEDVNGFESEFYMRLTKDKIGVRYFPDRIMHVDQAHGGSRLSLTAAVRDPASFVRVHRRMFAEHQKFFIHHPQLAIARARTAMRVAVRARAWRAAAYFAYQFLRNTSRSLFT